VSTTSLAAIFSSTSAPKSSAISKSSAPSSACTSSPSRPTARRPKPDPLVTIAGGGGVALYNAQGNAWTSDYLKISGELDVDLRSNIAAEARAKIVYERLIDHTDDPGTIDTLQFLMTREITHLKAFTAALESMEKPAFSIGFLKPTPGIVDEYFNASTGDGDEGETDMRGPWQTAFGLQPVESQMNGGPGLSIEDVNGTEDQEDRGKQDLGQKATTSPFAEALSQTNPSTNKPGANGHASSNGHSKASNHNGSKSKKTAKV
jgi:Mn-containing catalase